MCQWFPYVTRSSSHCLHPLRGSPIKTRVINISFIQKPLALCSQVWALTRQDRVSFIFTHSLFSLWVIRFWHYSWRAAMMQVFCSLQIKQRRWPFSFLPALAVWNWTLSILGCIMFRRSTPSAVFPFLAYSSPHEVLAWEASGCSNDTVFTNPPPWGRLSLSWVS